MRQVRLPHDVEVYEQSGLDPVQDAVHSPVLPQAFPTRAVVVFVHLPFVAEQMVQDPVHALSQQ